MKSYSFRVIIEPDGKRNYHGFVPILKGLHTWGRTIEEVRKNLNEAIKCHTRGLIMDGEKIPREEEAMETIQSFSEFELNPV